jgi:hypothetical protein
VQLPLIIENSIAILNGTIVFLKPLVSSYIRIQGNNIHLINIHINGRFKSNYAISIAKNVIGFQFMVGSIRNLQENNQTGNLTRGIQIEQGSRDFLIDRSTFKNIIPNDNGIYGDNKGAARAIAILGPHTNGVVRSCSFEAIQGFEDGDAISVQSILNDTGWATSKITISKCTFWGIYKRGIKVLASGVNIIDNIFYSTRTDSLLCPRSGISYYGNNGIIKGNYINFKRGTACIDLSTSRIIKNITIRDNITIINQDNKHVGSKYR